MLKAAVLALLAVMLFPLCAFSAGVSESAGVKIRIAFGDHEVIVRMLDTPASKEFLAMLPMTAEFSDYARAEKITHLPRRLPTQGTPVARDFSGGDFTYYAPWGNLAVFYKGFGSDGQLYVLGRIESGKDALAGMSGNFTARMEKVE